MFSRKVTSETLYALSFMFPWRLSKSQMIVIYRREPQSEKLGSCLRTHLQQMDRNNYLAAQEKLPEGTEETL